jgi:predicted transcriptional regulator
MTDLHVTEAESVVLGPLWRLGPLTPSRLIAEVKAVQPWADTTIKTLLARLARKGAVVSERIDGVARYRALITREAYLEAEIDALAARLFEGDREALAAFLRALEPKLGRS